MEYKPNPNLERDPWAERFTRWGDRLRVARLDSLVGVLLDAVEPLGPIGAQLLWVAQPTLSLFVSRTDVDSLARWLDEPGGIARMRAHLLANETDTGDRHL